MTERMSFPTLSILGLIFITLKLTGFIDWSWWLVLAPFLAWPVLVLAFFALALLGCVAAALVEKWR